MAACSQSGGWADAQLGLNVGYHDGVPAVITYLNNHIP